MAWVDKVCTTRNIRQSQRPPFKSADSRRQRGRTLSSLRNSTISRQMQIMTWKGSRWKFKSKRSYTRPALRSTWRRETTGKFLSGKRNWIRGIRKRKSLNSHKNYRAFLVRARLNRSKKWRSWEARSLRRRNTSEGHTCREAVQSGWRRRTVRSKRWRLRIW